QFDFSFDDIIKVLTRVTTVFKKEQSLIECRLPCVVVGDLHGQFHDLNRLFALFNKDGKAGWLLERYVFLGDYVDR
ncbi:hypothetical protein PFISCL1PPCAC_9390, partial [Pristionchus fissidentatus]